MKAICHKLLSMQDSVAYHFNGLLLILHFQVHKFSRVNSLISESILNATFYIYSCSRLRVFILKRDKISDIKKLLLGPIWTGKNGFANCFVFAKIFSWKNVCRGCWLHWHSKTTQTLCKRSKRLRGHRVSVVVVATRTHCWRSQRLYRYGQDYADTFRKLWMLLTDFKATIRRKTITII